MVPVSPRLRDFLERWLEETRAVDPVAGHHPNYDMFTRLYIVPDLGDRKLDKLMVRDVQVWVNTLRRAASAASRARMPRGLSRSAVRCSLP